MQIRERFRFVAIVGLVTAVLSAGFALASDTFEDPADESATCEPTAESDEAQDPLVGEDCDEADDPDEPVEDGEGTDETEESDDKQPAPEVSEERVAECTEAAGLTDEDTPDEEPTPGELKGLENAIAHVLWNCLRNDNDGLVNALEHLRANLERKLEREELKAERKAEREARKAERKAELAAAKAEREAERLARKAAREAAKAAGEHGHGS
jgi:hypothetical protein